MCVCVSVRDLQNWNVIVDLGAMLLRNALGDPDNVAAFLFLELQIGVEDAEVELLHKCVDVQFDLKMDLVTMMHRKSQITQTSCSKNLSSKVLSPGLLPDPSNNAAYSA